MLLLTRKTGESVVIDEDLEVFVMGIKGNSVKLGFKVPKFIPVHRREVLDKIRAEKEKVFLEKIAESNEKNEEDAKTFGIEIEFIEDSN